MMLVRICRSIDGRFAGQESKQHEKHVTHAAELVLELMIWIDKLLNK
jgi:hypothetical protein